MSKHIFNVKRSKFDGTEKVYDHKLALSMMPTVIDPNCDLRAIAPAVRDQGQEGACTAFAGTAVRTMLTGDPKNVFSPAFQYFMERSLEGTTGEDSGASSKDIITAMQTFGVCLESEMPYKAGNYATAPSAQAKAAALTNKIGGGALVSGVDGVRTAIFTRKQPCTIGMPVYESMESEAVEATGILPMPKKREQMLGGHEIFACGYMAKLPDSVRKKFYDYHQQEFASEDLIEKIIDFIFGSKVIPGGYLICQNSWSSTWGDQGYFYMPVEYFTKYNCESWLMLKTAGTEPVLAA